MSQSFSNDHFTNLPDNIADLATGLAVRLTEFQKRLAPPQGKQVRSQEESALPGNVLFYVPELHMDDAQYQGHGFLPHLVKKSFLDIDVGFVPVRQELTVRHAKMAGHFTYEDVHIDLFNRVHHPDYIIGGYEINGHRARGVIIPIPETKTSNVFVRMDEHWHIATETNSYAVATFHRYFLVTGVTTGSDSFPLVAIVNRDLSMMGPAWTRLLQKASMLDYRTQSGKALLANPQYYEHLGMFTNYQGALQFGVGLESQKENHQRSALQKYNLNVLGNQGNWQQAPLLKLEKLV